MTHPVSQSLDGFARRMRAVALAVLILGSAGTALAGQLEDADRAFQRTDYATALALWRPLAEQGNARAEVGLGKLYDSGFGVPKDPAQATVWFQKAANQGDAEGECITGLGYVIRAGDQLQDVSRGVALMKKAVDHGNAGCANQIGELYRNGLFGVPKDHVEAVAWHRRGAEMGDALAEGRLGTDYELGIGVRQDSAQAAYWHGKFVEHVHKEADRGDAVAQLILGESYEWGGSGLVADNAAAMYWCKKAAQQKSRVADAAKQCVAQVERKSLATESK
ncbi:tetratricopeptide repeat protein [Burkholderia arboris]|uniref:tetratricopeptide repeat protein n=1 Tax=Burkholderia arboris TaxID=488730 RepID=UPI001CA3B029|nr:tetratricopeptide repeat protein [Burkholderia arboris]MBY8603345.1 sel1 repeat family protein [Burkholderia arboris]MCA8051693.1 sel1 repeat family protein [Burkholderia arboris]